MYQCIDIISAKQGLFSPTVPAASSTLNESLAVVSVSDAADAAVESLTVVCLCAFRTVPAGSVVDPQP